MQELILIGAGGYAKSVTDCIDKSKYRIAGFVDKKKFGVIESHLGYPLLTDSIKKLEDPGRFVYFICIGSNRDRKHYYDGLEKRGLTLINVIDPTAVVSDGARVGAGVFVGKLAVVNNGAEVADNVIVNTRAVVEHGCVVSRHANISTNTVINGDVRVGEGTFVGSCSVVNGQLTIGSRVVIGSGAVVIDDIPDNVTAVGIPARVIKQNQPRRIAW